MKKQIKDGGERGEKNEEIERKQDKIREKRRGRKNDGESGGKMEMREKWGKRKNKEEPQKKL